MFGEQTYAISWRDFTKALKTKIEFNNEEELLVKRIIDNSNTGCVTRHKLSEFLKSFGPLSDCIKNVVKITTSSWFYGYMSLEESQKYLETENMGTFLVRFSNSKAGAFALDYVRVIAEVDASSQPLYGPMETNPISYLNDQDDDEDMENEVPVMNQRFIKTVSSVLIESVGVGFKLKENFGDKLFKSIHEVLYHYKNVLVRPLVSSLTNENWFYGAISADEAEDILSGQAPGTFLIRFSSQPGCFAASFVDGFGNICKSLIKRVTGGFSFENSNCDKIFYSIQELVGEFITRGVFVYTPGDLARFNRLASQSTSSFLSSTSVTHNSITPTSSMNSVSQDALNCNISSARQSMEWLPSPFVNNVNTFPATIYSGMLQDAKQELKHDDGRYKRTDVQLWSVDSVSNWLDMVELSCLRQTFKDHQINGIALLDLNELDMRNELNIVIGLRKQLLKSLQQFI
jgi:hypothetical protein